MISKEDLKKLATLSRLSLSEEELASLTKDVEGILSYVEQLKNVSGEMHHEVPEERNVLREDGEPHQSGAYTEALLTEAPEMEGGYIKVKKILG